MLSVILGDVCLLPRLKEGYQLYLIEGTDEALPAWSKARAKRF